MGHLNVITLTINLIQRNLQNKSSYLSVIKQACKSNKKYLKTIVLQREVAKKVKNILWAKINREWRRNLMNLISKPFTLWWNN